MTKKYHLLRKKKLLTTISFGESTELEKLYNRKEAAPLIGIHPDTLSRWCNAPKKSARPPHYRRGKRFVRFTASHITAARKMLEVNGGDK